MIKFEEFEVTCINKGNKPDDIHHLKWLREKKNYTVTGVALLVIKGDNLKFSTGRECFQIKGFGNKWFPGSQFKFDQTLVTKLILLPDTHKIEI